MNIVTKILLLIFGITAVNHSGVLAQIDARMLRQPDVSETQIVFSYADDIWIVSKRGGVAHRLTTAKGSENFPRFSPDGSMVAYTANYDGSNDIYVIPSGGGIP
ncbi:MAG: hypothetical protein R3224_08215, partial [Balneolaceae bacterium]|nr:hypothetical protein [Balneolaceae bacterium]